VVVLAGELCGQDLDMALIVVDGGASGCADPAFPEHTACLGHWASAIWESLLPLQQLQR
jgi:hypothetical protein